MPLTVPTLTLADADETPEKIIITVTGGNSGATNVLKRISWDGTIIVPQTWTTADTFTGNVTARKTAVLPGLAWYYLQSTLGAETVASNVVYRPIKNQTAAVQTRLVDAIVARLKSLAIDTIGDEVYASVSINELSISANKCQVIRSAAPQIIGSNSGKNFIQYSFLIAFTAADTFGQNSPEDKYDLWQQTARDAFAFRRLDDVPECRWCEVEPFIVPEPRNELLATVRVALVVRVICWENRGA